LEVALESAPLVHRLANTRAVRPDHPADLLGRMKARNVRKRVHGKFPVSSYLARKVFYVKWALGPIFRCLRRKSAGSRVL